mgnify:CR=1 FL=1
MKEVILPEEKKSKKSKKVTENFDNSKFVNYTYSNNENDAAVEDSFQIKLFPPKIPFPISKNPTFKFIDLFAGIGGFRLALQNLGGECVFTSEWDLQAQKTYTANFDGVVFGDITLEETKSQIPDNFDILCAGFPCQAFSIAGKRSGFEDTRGTLFFDVAEIISFSSNLSSLPTVDIGR